MNQHDFRWHYSYNNRVKMIQLNFVKGFIDRETSFTLFEDVLHDYGLLPAEERLDRTITNDNFLSLLRMAAQQRDVKSNRDLEVSPPELAPGNQNPVKDRYRIAGDLTDQLINLSKDRYRIADSLQNCPICKAKCSGLYNRMQGDDNTTVPVDPPRCHACMVKWVEEKFGLGAHSKIAAPAPSVTVDDSFVKPLDQAEIDWFKDLEKQMDGFKP